jgi:methionine synthase / methylenetetrahydrofolate reductase(NADPH)
MRRNLLSHVTIGLAQTKGLDRHKLDKNTMNPFLQRLHEQPLLADGAMGTMLYSRGASSEQCLEQLVIDRPGWVTGIHQAYATAGADIITSHTFGANRFRLAQYGLEDKVREFNFKAVRLVRDVREVTGRALFIAGNVGPVWQAHCVG